jgi:hypothetical protein
MESQIDYVMQQRYLDPVKLENEITMLIGVVDNVFDRRMRRYETLTENSNSFSAASVDNQGDAGRGESTHGILEEGNDAFPQG